MSLVLKGPFERTDLHNSSCDFDMQSARRPLGRRATKPTASHEMQNLEAKKAVSRMQGMLKTQVSRR
jgi:hypothetical protein